MGIAESILLAVVTSTAVVGLLTFAIKHYLQKAIDVRFKPLEQSLQLAFEERKQLSEAIVQQRVGIYPEILEITYRLRKLFEAGLESDAAVLWDQDIATLVHRLYEILFRARAFLPEDLFSALHEYKRASQDVVQILDVLTRADNVANRDLYRARRPELADKVQRVQELYPRIQTALSFRSSLS